MHPCTNARLPDFLRVQFAFGVATERKQTNLPLSATKRVSSGNVLLQPLPSYLRNLTQNILSRKGAKVYALALIRQRKPFLKNGLCYC